MEPAWDGKGRAYSGLVEAADEFGLGRVYWTNLCCAIRPLWDGLVARDGV